MAGDFNGGEEPAEDFGGDEPTENFEDRKFRISPAGRETLVVIAAIDCWLANAPGGRLSLAVHREAHVPFEILLDGWNSGIVTALAPGPLSSTELGLAIDTLSRISLREKLAKLTEAGLLEARPPAGEGSIYAVTDWLREAVGPLLVGVRAEMRNAGRETTPDAPDAIEAVFLLALPLLELPAELSGHCRLLVDLPESEESRAAGTMIQVEDGRIASCSVDLEGSADSWAIGPGTAWLEAAIDGRTGEIEFGGEERLARAVLAALHSRLPGLPPPPRPEIPLFPNKTD
jgi:DNA-binding HxlR family transcriptional regulator